LTIVNFAVDPIQNGARLALASKF